MCNDVPLNFSWIVNLKKDMFSGRILIFFKNLEQTGVVYDFVTTNIKQSPSDVTKTVHMYHSQTNPDRKKAIVDSLSRPLAVGEMTVVHCTSSFSLGLNLRDIEYVVHYDLPHSLTDYVQETGRAAREPTTHGHAIILAYDKMSVGTKVERAMQEVAKTKMCRRDCIMSYFRLTPSPNVKCCDICNQDLAELCPIIPYIRVNREQTGQDTISTVTPSSYSTPSLSSISDMSD